MIDITFNNDGKDVRLQVIFYYPDKHKPVKKQKYVHARLSVLTDKLNDRGNRKWECFAEGKAVLHSVDRGKFNKHTGRKHAFDNVVKQVEEKEIRTLLWKEFIKKFGV
jgi:hypothetical protein